MAGAVNYFPEGVAKGHAFINRVEERQAIISRIETVKHTVLIAPRRYGKTSLVIKVADDMKLPYCMIDLLAAYNEDYVRKQFVNKIGSLVFELLPNLAKAKEKLITLFKKLKPEISIGAFGQKLTFDLSSDPLQDITELLLTLDSTAKHFKKRAIIFIDEFQQISQLKNGHAIEAAIRHAVERSECISYVFSGSNRQLLRQMFGDRGRPLYRLCQTITLERITEEHYIKQLKSLSKKKWHEPLSDDIIQQILTYTERHSYYTNVLCQHLWERKNIPTEDDVTKTWDHYVNSQRHIIGHDLINLSNNQRKLLTALAKTPCDEIQSSAFTSRLKISASSAQQAVDTLIKKDLVYKKADNSYHVLDPAVKFYLNVTVWNV